MMKETDLDEKTEAIDAAVEAASDNKHEAITKFMEAEFAVMDAFRKQDNLRKRGKRQGDPKYDEATNRIDEALAARDRALDDLIAAEFAWRAAEKAWDAHHSALDKARGGGATEKLQ
jgi:hypothetical protein